MSTRSNHTNGLIALLAAGLAIAIIALSSVAVLAMTRSASAQTASAGPIRQVTVIGSGEVRGTPDTATVQIGVETTAPTSAQALEQNSTQVDAVIKRIKALGIADKDIQTSNFSIFPTYDEKGRQITGYSVTNTVAVTIRNLDQTGALLDQVVKEGANRIYGINFSVADTSALLAQARDKAMANARINASQLAKGGNASLGEVLVITENIGSGPVVPMPMARGEAAQAMDSVPVQAGEQSFTVQVQVTYELS